MSETTRNRKGTLPSGRKYSASRTTGNGESSTYIRAAGPKPNVEFSQMSRKQGAAPKKTTKQSHVFADPKSSMKLSKIPKLPKATKKKP